MRGLTLVVLACACFLTKTSAEELTHQQAVKIIAGALKDAIYKEVAKEITKDETETPCYGECCGTCKDQQDAARDVLEELEKDAPVEENLDLKDAADPYGSVEKDQKNAVMDILKEMEKDDRVEENLDLKDAADPYGSVVKKDEPEAPEDDGASAVEKREEVNDPLTIKITTKKTKGYCPTSKPFAFAGGKYCCPTKKGCTKCTKDVCSNSPLKMAYKGKCKKIMTKKNCEAIAKQKHAKDNTIKGELVTHFLGSAWDPYGCSYLIEKVKGVRKITQVVWNGSWVHASCKEDRPCICINA